MSAAGSLGAEIVAAPLEHFSVKWIRFTAKKCGETNKRADSTQMETALEVAAAAIGAAGEVVTSALGGASGEDRGTSDRRNGGRRVSSRKNSSAVGD